jgi:hypothetical protein
MFSIAYFVISRGFRGNKKLGKPIIDIHAKNWLNELVYILLGSLEYFQYIWIVWKIFLTFSVNWYTYIIYIYLALSHGLFFYFPTFKPFLCLFNFYSVIVHHEDGYYGYASMFHVYISYV